MLFRSRTQYRYVEWVFDRALFECSTSGAILGILAQVGPGRELPPVYAETTRGGPYGGSVRKLLTRPEHRIAVLAQAVGRSNPFPCSHCENALRASDREDQRGMAPFLGCVSYVPYHRACGNCLMVGRNTACEWVDGGEELEEIQTTSSAALGLSHADTQGGLRFAGADLVRIAKEDFNTGKPSW